MPRQYRVALTAADRRDLTAITRHHPPWHASGAHPARPLTRAHALLLADRRRSDADIATALGISARTVQRLRRRAYEVGVMAALEDRPRPGAQPKLDGSQEALLVALACSDPPTGRDHWPRPLDDAAAGRALGRVGGGGVHLR